MWVIYALSASMLWGLTYVLSEQIYKKISVLTSLAITNIVAFIIILLFALQKGVFKKDIDSIMSSPTLMYLVIAETIVFLLAELCIALSISNKNATLAGLIEISYPLFIALFAYLIFKEDSISISTFVGAELIFAGVLIIYVFN